MGFDLIERILPPLENSGAALLMSKEYLYSGGKEKILVILLHRPQGRGVQQDVDPFGHSGPLDRWYKRQILVS